MRIWKAGETTRILCQSCDQRVEAVFSRRPVYLEETDATVPDVLVGICPRCDGIAGIPPQSTPRLAEARERKTRKLEVRIPAHLNDLLSMICRELDAPQDSFAPMMFRYYMHECVESRTLASWIARLTTDEMLSGSKGARISLRLTESQWNTLLSAWKASGVKNRTVFVNCLVLAAWHDVKHSVSRKRRRDLKRLAKLVA